MADTKKIDRSTRIGLFYKDVPFILDTRAPKGVITIYPARGMTTDEGAIYRELLARLFQGRIDEEANMDNANAEKVPNG